MCKRAFAALSLVLPITVAAGPVLVLYVVVVLGYSTLAIVKVYRRFGRIPAESAR